MRQGPRRIEQILLLAAILFAFALRLYLLDNQSFAFDEGWTSYAIHHSWRDMWGVLAPDNHPPLYYALVKAFADLAGYGDFAQRFFSVLCGTALVLGLYVLGKRLAGAVGGLAAAWFGACSPSLVYYAQEARMYSLWMALAVFSSYSLVRWIDDIHRRSPVRRRWLVGAVGPYVLTTVGALYTHYFAALLILIQNGAFLAWLVAGWAKSRIATRNTQLATRHSPLATLGAWALGQGAIVLLYLPWLPTAIGQVRVGQGTWWRMPLPWRMILNDIWLFYILGPHRPPDVSKFGSQAAPVALAVLIALLIGWRRATPNKLGSPERGRRGGSERGRPAHYMGRWAFVLALSILPVASFVWVGSHFPIYTDRYTLIAAPGLALLVGTAVSACWDALARRGKWLGRVAALLLLAAAIGGPLPQLGAYYHDPRYWREDFRRAAQYAMDTTGLGDAVILLGCWQPIMQYYRGQATALRFPQQGDSVQDEDEVVSTLRQAIRPGSQVRLIMHSWPTVDPQGLVEGQLRLHCRLQGEHWQRETGQRPIRVMNFEGCAGFAAEPRQPFHAVWEDGIALDAYRLVRFVPGEQAHVVLWWRALGRPARNYSVFVHLLGADGQMIAQFDKLPLNDFYPMRAWPLNVGQRDDYPLNLPADVDLEGAWLAIGLYDRSTMRRLTVVPCAVPGAVPAEEFVRISVAGGSRTG